MRRVFFALLALLLSVQFTTAQAETRALLGERFTSGELELLNYLANDEGSAELIVGLNVPFAPEGTLGPSEVTAQRQEIASATAALSAQLSNAARQTIRQYQSVPFMAVQVSPADLDVLAGSTLTRSLQRDLTNEPAARVPSGSLNAQPLSLPAATPRHGDGQVVAVIDTGVLAAHAAFNTPESRIVHQACFSRVGLCSEACAGADNGCENGTHMAGIAAGAATGFSGVAPGARIMSIRVSSLEDGWAAPQAWDSDIISGLEEVLKKSGEYAVAAVTLGFHDTGIDVFEENCDASKLALKAAIDNLKSLGIATIAAGGDYSGSGFLTSPGCISSAVSVGAVSAMNWNNCSFRNSFGDNQPTAADKILCTSNIAPFLSLLAPGAPIRSALTATETSPGAISNYGPRGGSAMAAAQVAGAWAVLKQKAPEASVDSILGVLKSTGVPITRSEGTFPRIDVPRALDEIARKKIVYTREGTGTGRVTFTAGAQACDLSCERVFLNGGAVTLTASASPGSVFAGWSGACEGTSPSCTVQVSNAILVTATFNTQVAAYPLTVSKTGNGQVNCNGGVCATSYTAGTVVTLRATPDTGWQFASWTGCAAAAATPDQCTVTLSQARTVTARFTQLPVTYPLTVSKTGNGQVNCNGGVCAASYTAGTVVTLRATPDTGWQFASWTGCAAAAATPDQCTVTLSQARTVTASFTQLPVTYPLTVSKTGNGQVNCNGGVCAASYTAGTVVTLRATPDTGWQFASWTGCAAAAATPDQCTLTLSQARTVTASFTEVPEAAFTISYTKSGSGAGNVTFTSRGRVETCADNCRKDYDRPTLVQLVAVAEPGSTFIGWQGDCSGTRACIVALRSARSVTAMFERLIDKELTFTKAGTGDGTLSVAPLRGTPASCVENCTLNFGFGTTLTLTAVPSSGSVFTGWSGACSGARACTVTMDADRPVTANFEKIVEKELVFTKAGTGDGTLDFAPLGGTPDSCVDNCTRSFAFGTTLTLTAVPRSGSVFTGWSGDCAGARTCSVTMDAARSVTAIFDTVTVPTLPTLTYVKAGSGSGTVSFENNRRTEICDANCTKEYPDRSRVMLLAMPERGSVFVGWQGDCRSNRYCIVAMTGARSVTAVFEKITLPVLSYENSGTGSGRVSFLYESNAEACEANCTKEYPTRSLVRLVAAPAPGSVFVGWAGDCSGNLSCLVSMTGDRSVTAIFDEITLDPVSMQ